MCSAMREKLKLAFKLSSAKSNTQGNLLFLFVSALTGVAVFERIVSGKASREKEPQNARN